MKKNNFFSIAMFAFAALFCGCSNISEPSSAEPDSEKMTVSLSKNEMRAIYAVDYKLSDVSVWTLTFTGTVLGEEKTYEFSTGSDEESSKLAWNSGNNTFSMSKIPVGTYTLEISGSGVNSGKSFSLYGSKTGFSVSAEGVTTEKIDVHLKNESTGNLNLTLSTENLSDTGSLTENNISSFKAVLTPKNGVNNGESIELNSSSGISIVDSNIVLLKEGIPSGWYVISFSFNDGTNQYKYRIGEYSVQIADGITTTSSQKLSCVTEKTYYATNSTSSYAGLAKSYPVNLTKLLGTTFVSSLPDVTDINIFMTGDESAEINIAALTKLQSVLKTNIENKKFNSINIYNSSDTENAVLSITSGSAGSSSAILQTVISGSVVVTAADDDSSLQVTSITPSADSMIITLKNGANLTTEYLNFGNYKIAVRTVDSTTVNDNFTSYVSAPFITYMSTTVDSVEGSILLYSYDGTESLDNWTCSVKSETTTSDDGETTTYGIYALPAASVSNSIVNLSESIAITAVDADSVSYADGSTFTYKDEDLTFSLGGVDGIEISSYTWQLNGQVVGTESSLVLNPTESEAVLPEEENTLSCYVVVNSTVYLAEMNFNFKADYNTNAVYVNSVDSAFMQVFYDSSVTGSTIMTDLSGSVYYAFDGEGNLYVAKFNNSLLLYKYVKSVASGGFSSAASVSADFTDISSSPAYADICYDTVNDLVYVLWTTSVTSDSTTSYVSTVYAFSGSDSAFTQVASTTVSVPATLTTVIAGKFSQIAVYGSDVYLADADLNVLKVDFTVTKTDSGVSVTPGTPSVISLGATITKKLSIDSDKYDSDGWDTAGITDLIVGDGCGNSTSTLYALVREASSSIYGGGTSDKYYFSRGALLTFSTSAGSEITVTGWSTTESKLAEAADSTLCAPLYDEENVFFGPVHFACVMPKKLVIADDGFTTKDASSKNLYNKDGFFVFDIESSSLTQQEASVTMSKPEQANYSSTFTIN